MRYLLATMIISICLVACEIEKTPSEQSEQAKTKEITTCGNIARSSSNSDEEYVVKPIRLIKEALGKLERTITTNNPVAQQFFNQGLQLKYAFAVDEAVSSFREAQKLDPECAMCYWGEAWALGSYLNGHMSETKAPLALAAITRAIELTGNANNQESDLIEAMTSRYIEDYVFDDRRVQDSIYALAMERVYNKYPDDLDIATVYAEALFLLEPRGGTRELDDPAVVRIHDVLEKVLESDIQHPGACHLYIHATESTPEPQLGESCADYLGSAIPGASHINHMPSHTYNEIGKWGESVKANLQAWHTDRRAEDGQAIAIYPSHNLHMLLFAASYDGQGAIAMQAGRDFSRLNDNSMHYALTSIRFGRFDEVLEMNERPEEVIPAAFWDFCQGYARLKKGEPDFARVYLKRVLTTADTSQSEYRWHSAEQLLGMLGAILEGEISLQERNLGAAVKSFRKAVEIEDNYPYSEPEPLPFAARQWLGVALMESGRFAEAEKAYREELEDHPHNGWSLFGLIQALKAQAKSYEIEQEDFEASWARSDTWLQASRF